MNNKEKQYRMGILLLYSTNFFRIREMRVFLYIISQIYNQNNFDNDVYTIVLNKELMVDFWGIKYNDISFSLHLLDRMDGITISKRVDKSKRDVYDFNGEIIIDVNKLLNYCENKLKHHYLEWSDIENCMNERNILI